MKAMFEETIVRVLADTVTTEVVTAAETGIWPGALWQAIEDNGLGIAAAPEARGGVGGSWHDAYGLIRAAGRHAVPAPLAETILANWLLGRVGMHAVVGPVTIGHSDGSLRDGRFYGTLADVPWGRTSHHVVTVAGDRLLLLRSVDGVATTGFNTAREARDTLVFTGAVPVASQALGDALPLDAIQLGGAMIRSAQIAGALTSSAAEAAFATADDRLGLLAVAAAKSVGSEAAGRGASIAHAVFGAIGFTYEHSMHFTTRRLWSWRSEFGSQAFWATKLGEAACGGGAAAFWPSLTAGSLGR